MLADATERKQGEEGDRKEEKEEEEAVDEMKLEEGDEQGDQQGHNEEEEQLATDPAEIMRTFVSQVIADMRVTTRYKCTVDRLNHLSTLGESFKLKDTVEQLKKKVMASLHETANRVSE